MDKFIKQLESGFVTGIIAGFLVGLVLGHVFVIYAASLPIGG